jgi:hypothetical protein
MFRRMGYRRILPLANLLLYLALVGYGDWGLVQRVRLYREMDATRVSMGEAPWNPVYIDAPTPLPKALAVSVNFPAVLFAAPFELLAEGWRSELIVDAVAAVYVLLLWYSVGRWMDVRTKAAVKAGRVLTIFRQTMLVLACLAALGMAGLFVVSITRYPEAWPHLVLALPIVFWPAFLAYVARWELRSAKGRALEVGAV